ncbi:MAG: energy transducer TonB [Verrucomicrobiota bacterium]|nr:energy transducer TonB [Verrucomicrobiota bacterium]
MLPSGRDAPAGRAQTARSRVAAYAARAAPIAPAWTWRSVLTAAGVTALTFVLLPYLQTLSSRPARHKLARDVNIARLAPPPLPLPMEPQPLATPAGPNLPKPRLAQDRQTIPVKAMLDFDLAMPGLQIGDFAMDFAMNSSNLFPEAENFVFDVGDVDEPPQPVVQIHPVYPDRARMRGMEGRVTIEFVVTAEGKTSQIKALERAPDDMFAQAALRAAERWLFRPAAKARWPVAARARQTIRFQMED